MSDYNRKNINILIVDDEQEIEKIFSYIFENECDDGIFKLSFADSGESALEFLEHKQDIDNEITLVLSDIGMPQMDGFELLTLIKDKYPNLPVGMISAHDEDDFINKAKGLGAEDYFTKPLNFKKLKDFFLKDKDKAA